MKFFFLFHQWSMRFDRQIYDWGGALLGLGLRVFVGWQFFKSGFIKLEDWNATLSLFRDEYMVPFFPPELAAIFGTAGEIVLPILLVVGFFSRPAAFGLFLLNVMAVLSYPQLWMFDCPAAINDHIYWGVVLLALFVYGPGKMSLDVILQRHTKLA